jgi:hypothetical protein
MLIRKDEFRRDLTPEGQEFFQEAFNNLIIQEGIHSLVRFGPDEYQGFSEIAELRRRNWGSTSRWNEKADITGLLGELSVFKYLGFTAQEAMASFIDGLTGDCGYDVIV